MITENPGPWRGTSEEVTRSLSKTINDIILGPRQIFPKLGKEAFVDLKFLRLSAIKMVRATAAAVRANIGDNQITRDVPESERKSDEELLEAGIESANPKATNRDRWREAPYCWNEKGFLYEEHHHLGEERDPTTIEYIWDDYPVEIC